jgi:hypothetical protein
MVTNSNELAQVQNAWHAVGIGAASTVCVIPASLSGVPTSSSTATVSWSASSGASKYNLRYKKSTESTFIAVLGIPSTTYKLKGLAANTYYDFKVSSVCPGNGQSPNKSCINI